MIGLDWIILIVIAAGAFIGWQKGFLKQLTSFVGFFVGLLLACLLYHALGDKLAPALGTSATLGHFFAFIILWIAVPWGLSLVASLLVHVLKAVSLGFFDSLSGALIGALKYALFISIFINMLQFLDFKEKVISHEKKETSALYYPVGKMVKFLLPEQDEKKETSAVKSEEKPTAVHHNSHERFEHSR